MVGEGQMSHKLIQDMHVMKSYDPVTKLLGTKTIYKFCNYDIECIGRPVPIITTGIWPV